MLVSQQCVHIGSSMQAKTSIEPCRKRQRTSRLKSARKRSGKRPAVTQKANFGGLARSELMSRIRSAGNKQTELALIELMRSYRISGWRRYQLVFGKPDFVFRKERVAVFVDGCFWHGCPRCYKRPRTNKAFWDNKVRRNRARDYLVTCNLRSTGWQVIRLWQHELGDWDAVARLLRKALLRRRSPR